MGALKFVTCTIWILLAVDLLWCDFCSAEGQGASRFEDDPISRGRKSPRDSMNKLIVKTVLNEPYMMLKQHSMGSFMAGNDRFEGYMADILKNLSQAIGFNYEIKLSLEGKFGESDLDGRWNGLIGEIQRGEADMAVGPIIVTSEREEVVDFTDPFMAFRSTALIKKPHKRRKHNQIENAEDLLHSDIMYGVMDGSITQRLLRTEDNPLYRTMWARMVNFWPTPFVQSVEEGIERARRENYALILDSPAAEYVVGKDPCEFYTIEPFLSTRRYAIALRKNDGLKRVINEQLKNMHNRQILTEFYLKWWRSKCDLYIPRPDLVTDPPEPQHTTRMSNRLGKRGYLASRGTSRYVSHQGLFYLTFIFVLFTHCYGFSYHDILIFGLDFNT